MARQIASVRERKTKILRDPLGDFHDRVWAGYLDVLACMRVAGFNRPRNSETPARGPRRGCETSAVRSAYLSGEHSDMMTPHETTKHQTSPRGSPPRVFDRRS